MDVKTIDDRIRAKAREELKRQIQEAAGPLQHELRTGYPIAIDQPITPNTPCSVVLEKLINAIVAHKAAAAEENAVAAFLVKIDRMSPLREAIA